VFKWQTRIITQPDTTSDHATDRQQRSGAEAKFVGTQNRADDDVAREFQAPVHAEREA
jgi:hypothetical protein